MPDQRRRAVREREQFRQIVRAKAAELRIHGITGEAAAADVNFIFLEQHERRIGKRMNEFDVIGGMCGFAGRDGTGEELKQHKR